MGNGNLSNSDGFEEDVIEIPNEIVAENLIVRDIFGSSLRQCDVASYSKSAILCPRNEDVISINEEVINLLEGEKFTYLSIDSVECDDISEKENYPIEFLNSLTPSGMPPHKLNVKVGAIIMLLRNLNTRRGLCNGTRLQITKLSPNLICATILTGTAQGTPAFIPRIELAPVDPDLPFVLRRRQFPVRLAFSITINKSQGQTLDKVGVYLCHGSVVRCFFKSYISEKCEGKGVKSRGETGNAFKKLIESVFKKRGL